MTPEEDIILVSYIQEHGPGNWRSVPINTGLMRFSKSCRLRWTNYLRPGIRRGNFAPHEEAIVVHLQFLLGNRYSNCRIMQMGGHSFLSPSQNRQRHQELLEHPPQEEAQEAPSHRRHLRAASSL
jgi:hypothetical protein